MNVDEGIEDSWLQGGKDLIWDVLEDCFVAFTDLARRANGVVWRTTHCRSRIAHEYM